MPRKPNIPCKHPGCPKLVSHNSQYCEEHKELHKHEYRTSQEKGYTSRWRKARSVFLKTHPLCESCKKNGRLVKAAVVDHIIPHRGDQDLFWDRSNWQALCKSCHDRKTMTEDRYQEFKY